MPLGSPLVSLRDLDQISARVVEHRGGHGSHLCRRLGEPDAKLLETLVFSVDVGDRERGKRDPVGDEGVLEGFDGRVIIRLKQQFGQAITILGSGELVRTLMDHHLIDEWESDSIWARMSRKADPEFVLADVVRRAYRDYGKASKFLH